LIPITSVSGPHWLYTDPDPAFRTNADPDPVLIRIQKFGPSCPKVTKRIFLNQIFLTYIFRQSSLPNLIFWTDFPFLDPGPHLQCWSGSRSPLNAAHNHSIFWKKNVGSLSSAWPRKSLLKICFLYFSWNLTELHSTRLLVPMSTQTIEYR
jgi:hypothetical protein